MKNKKRKKLGRRILSFVLTATLITGWMPGNVLAVKAEENTSTPPSVTAFATPEQLMSSDNFALHTDYNGVAQKVYFGTNGESQQTWYIAGSDADNSIVLLCDPTLPLATLTMFENDWKTNKIYESSWNCTYKTAPSEVYPNHYGASDLRLNTLKNLETNTDIFTASEQSMMLATRIYTDDDKLKDEGNSEYTYYTEDKLYAAYGDYSDDKYITVGTNSADGLNGGIKVSLTSAPYNSGDFSWLRAPLYGNSDNALVAYPGRYVGDSYVSYDGPVVPAFRLNLSSVLFASAAPAATSDTAESGVIAEGTAMTLRVDGSGSGSTIAIGEVLYDADKGLILAKKDASAGAVAMVVQGKDGTNDWYYSKTIDGTEWIFTTDIESALSITDISLSDCKIWLETTDATGSSLRYAVMAEAGTIIDNVAITDIDTPAGGTALDTSATSETVGLVATDLTVAWTKNGEAAGETADYDTTYTACITLTPVEKAAFVSGATATVNGNAATVTSNTDGTVTVTYDFTTAKRKLVSIATPAVPENNRFTSEYTAENVLSSTELGTTVLVTLEGTTEPVTVDMAVAWSLANENNAEYDTTSSATNTFQWTVNGDAYAGYDTNNVTLEGMVDIKNACTEHIPNEDDGDCTTAITCSECGTVTTEAKAGHTDENADGKCDNCGSFVDGIGAQLMGYSVSLDGNIGINFYMELDETVINDVDAYVQFTLDGKDYQRVMVSDAESAEVNNKTYKVFKCGIPAKDMEKTITAQIVLDADTKGKTYSFTVKGYADYILDENNNYSEATKNVVNAMLTYGDYAKAYFDKETLTATTEISQVTAETLSKYASTVTNNGTGQDVVPYYGSSLLLESEVVLRHYFTEEVDGATQLGNYWYIDIANIPAHKLHENIVTTVGDITISYSPLSYAYAVLNGGSTDESLQNLVKAMYLYNRSAYEYAASNTQ